MNVLPKSKTYGVRLNRDKHEDIMKFLEKHNHSEVLLNALIQYVRRLSLQSSSELVSLKTGHKNTTYGQDAGQTSRVAEPNRQVNGNEVSQEAKEVYESIYDILGSS